MADSQDGLRAQARRFFRHLALGFTAMVAGIYVSASLTQWLLPWFLGSEAGPGVLFAQVLLARLWIVLALPLVCTLAAFVMDLQPVSSPVVTALAGELFVNAVWLTSAGLNGLVFDAPTVTGWLVTTAGGLGLSYLGITRVQRWTARRQQASAQAAREKKAEYDAFLAEAQRISDRPPPVSSEGGSTPERP